MRAIPLAVLLLAPIVAHARSHHTQVTATPTTVNGKPGYRISGVFNDQDGYGSARIAIIPVLTHQHIYQRSDMVNAQKVLWLSPTIKTTKRGMTQFSFDVEASSALQPGSY